MMQGLWKRGPCVFASNSHGKNHSQILEFPVTYRNMFVTVYMSADVAWAVLGK